MEYIYTNKSLTTDFCKKVIKYYDDDNELKYQGVTYKGLDKRIKDTTDLIIPNKSHVESKWDEINDLLSSELEKNLKKYISGLNTKSNYMSKNNYEMDYKHLHDKLYLMSNFMIQKYDKNIGKYVYHDDGSVDIKKKNYRVVTYLWYLNDVEEGGETEFFGGDFKIKPEVGKLLFFPSFWCFPHRGNQPKSSYKYIITGWLYKDAPAIEFNNLPNISLSIKPNSLVNLNTENKIVNNLDELKLVFDYFYKKHQWIFKDYKNYLINKTTFLQEAIINDIYSENMCAWIVENSEKEALIDAWNIEPNSNNKFLDLNKLTVILPLIISSFQMISNIIKLNYNLSHELNFNIKEWYIIKYEPNNIIIPTVFQNKQYDISISIPLNNYCAENEIDKKANGFMHVSKTVRYNKYENYVLVYLIDFSFKYLDKNNETRNISLKDIVYNFLDKIYI